MVSRVGKFFRKSKSLIKKSLEEQKTFNEIIKADRKILKRRRSKIRQQINRRIARTNKAFLDFD